MLVAADFAHLAPHLEHVELLPGDRLIDADRPARYAYFPLTTVVFLHLVTASGDSVEIASVGHEGVVGIASFLGGDFMPCSAVVGVGGGAYRVESRWLQAAALECKGLRMELLRYTGALLAQMGQNAVCYRFHAVDQRLCRWLLLTADRAATVELVVTHELVATLLGVRREGVTEAARRLQQAGYIQYRRGHLSIIDRAGLKASACECYEVIRCAAVSH